MFNSSSPLGSISNVVASGPLESNNYQQSSYNNSIGQLANRNTHAQWNITNQCEGIENNLNVQIFSRKKI
jgi:hypothetical protein